MNKKIFTIVILTLLISACGGNGGSKNTVSSLPENNIASNGTPLLSLEIVDFSSDLDVSKVKVECSMLEKLAVSILDSAGAYKANIKRIDVSSPTEDTPYILRATYVDVVPHKWRFPSIRPGSIATVKAELIKDGKVLKSTSKEISSGVALSACSRLEKIAAAGGRYISKWASRQTYD